METNNKRFLASHLMVIVALLSFFSACTPGQQTATKVPPSSIPDPTHATTSIPTEVQTPGAPTSLPEITLKPGDMYFSVNGKPTFIFSRNLAGITPGDYELLIDWAQKSGTLVVRVGVDNQSMSVDSFG